MNLKGSCSILSIIYVHIVHCCPILIDILLLWIWKMLKWFWNVYLCYWLLDWKVDCRTRSWLDVLTRHYIPYMSLWNEILSCLRTKLGNTVQLITECILHRQSSTTTSYKHKYILSREMLQGDISHVSL